MTMWLVSMVFFIVSQLLGGVNYVTTVINLRTRGMSMSKLPLTIWAFFLTAILGILYESLPRVGIYVPDVDYRGAVGRESL